LPGRAGENHLALNDALSREFDADFSILLGPICTRLAPELLCAELHRRKRGR
jgi:hypothetical protein